MKKAILITGGAGFIGSNLAIALKKKYPHYAIIAFDNLSRKGSELNPPRLKKNGVRFVRGDVRRPGDLARLGKVSALIECSAEPSVLAGIHSSPANVLDNNLFGAVNCLNFAIKYKTDFIFLSTSRVYPIRALEGLSFKEKPKRFEWTSPQRICGASSRGISEKFPMEGYRSLYGASKLCAEILIEEYRRYYGLKTVINRCGVVAGPWQMGKVDQGVVALWAARHFWNKAITYLGYGGQGKQTRDVLHVEDLFRLVDYEIHHMQRVSGEVFNVGGGRKISASLAELTDLCRKISGQAVKIKKVHANRPADVRIFLTDHRKVTRLTGWKPQIPVVKIVKDVYEWIHRNSKVLEPILK